MNTIVLGASVAVVVAAFILWVRTGSESKSRVALDVMMLAPFLASVGLGVVIGLDVFIPWLFVLSGVAMLAHPLVMTWFVGHIVDMPRWGLPLTMAGFVLAMAVFSLEEFTQVTVWPIAFFLFVLIPYAVSAVVMWQSARPVRGVAAMRQRYGAVGSVGLGTVTLASAMTRTGFAPVFSDALLQWGMLFFAAGVVFGAVPPAGFVRMWRSAAIESLRLDLPALRSDLDEQAYLDDGARQASAFVVPGTLTIRQETVTETERIKHEAGGESWRVPLGETGWLLEARFALNRVFPHEDKALFEALASLFHGRLLALRSVKAQREELAKVTAVEKIKSEFLRTVGHELGNPLSPIRLQLAVLKRKSPEEGGFKVIERNVDRLGRIIQNIKDMGRLQDQNLPLVLGEMDLSDVVVEVADSVRPAADEAKLSLVVETTPCVVMADRGRIEQILGNLLSNAIKYTPTGSIRVHVANDTDGATVTIQDTGLGLTAEQLDVIGQPYQRFHDDTVSEGTGIGLHVTRSLVEAHGGSLEFESAGAGQGTTVRAKFPRDGASARASNPAA